MNLTPLSLRMPGLSNPSLAHPKKLTFTARNTGKCVTQCKIALFVDLYRALLYPAVWARASYRAS